MSLELYEKQLGLDCGFPVFGCFFHYWVLKIQQRECMGWGREASQEQLETSDSPLTINIMFAVQVFQCNANKYA